MIEKDMFIMVIQMNNLADDKSVAREGINPSIKSNSYHENNKYLVRENRIF